MFLEVGSAPDVGGVPKISVPFPALLLLQRAGNRAENSGMQLKRLICDRLNVKVTQNCSGWS